MEPLTNEELIIFKWQYHMMGDFSSTLMKAITLADDDNLNRISLGYPEHVSGYRKYSTERGWWQNVQAKAKILNYYM